MTLRHLEIFRAVCAQESITLAAEQLGIAQPTASVAIRELESFYQTRLFDRMNRRIYLTQSGAALLEYANSILDRFQESVESLRHPAAPGKLRLGVNATVGETRLADILSVLKSANPAQEILISVDNSAATEARLGRNEIDLAIIDEVAQLERWQATLLFVDEMVIAGPAGRFAPGEKIAVAELSRQRLLLREQGSGSRKCVEAVFARHGCPFLPIVQSASTLTLLALAEAGAGLTLVPQALVKPSMSFAEPADDRFLRSFYLIHHPQKYLSPAILSAIERLRRQPTAG